MADDAIRKLLETQEVFRRQFEPLSATLKGLAENANLRRLAEDLNRHQEAMRVAYGPLEDLHRTGLLNPTLQVSSEFQRLSEVLTETQVRFRLPEIAEATKLFRDWQSSKADASAIACYQEQASEFLRAIQAMRAPWLDMDDQLRSIGGFVELQSIGHALRTMPAFDARLADAIRTDLGDWRDKLLWPPEIFTDSVARTSFYAAQGLEPALTSFPAQAFEQSISIAGLNGAPPSLIRGYYVEPEVEPDDALEAGFERTNAAHDRLQRFESQLRKFIDEKMKAVFGDSWTKHRVPGDIRKAWLEKQKKARDSGEPELPLIAYADFADYVPIITRKDNWESVFARIFGRTAFVQESFQRLYPIRICTMHARFITHDDELYLHVETKRLLAAIGLKT
jgi:hypothetical protein